MGRISRAAGRFCTVYGQSRVKAGEEPQGFHRVARMAGSSQGIGCLSVLRCVSADTKVKKKVKNVKTLSLAELQNP